MSPKNIHIFVISLAEEVHRRQFLEEQLRALNLRYTIVDAVDGAQLAGGELDCSYDSDKALRLFNRELSKGEIGCALSHLSIYRKMVEEYCPYALVLEDDAKILDKDISRTLARIAGIYSDQTPAVVLLNHVMRYDANTKIALNGTHGIYDAYRGVCSHAYFITRSAAKILMRNLYPVHVVADKWEYIQQNFVSVKALVPYSVGLTAASHTSSIDGRGARVRKVLNRKSFAYYLRRYVDRTRFFMRSRPFIRVEYQPKSRLDLE
jgi:glycosyl transferase family 25